MNLYGGQRGLVFALTAIVMLIFGAILGQPGEFPTVEAQAVFTPDYVFELVTSLVAPLTLLVGSFWGLGKALTARVNDPKDPFKAEDFTSLLASKEFWVYVVSAAMGLGQMFGLEVMEAEKQALIVNGIMALSTFLLSSWGERPSGAKQNVQIVKLE